MPIPVQSAAPLDMSHPVVLLRPLQLQHSFGFSVASLLLPISSHGLAAMMPHGGAGTESQGPSAISYPPADIDVVAGCPELGVKSTDCQKAFPPKCHVAAGDVFGLLVRKQNVGWSARGVGYALCNRSVALGWKIRPTNTCMAC